MQAKHDAVIGAHCRTLKLQPRATDGTQIRHGIPNATGLQVLAAFYRTAAQVAAEVARDHMIARWRLPQRPGQSTFTPGERVDAAVQMQVQRDGNQYELSYWFDSLDIYVLFHVYPPR